MQKKSGRQRFLSVKLDFACSRTVFLWRFSVFTRSLIRLRDDFSEFIRIYRKHDSFILGSFRTLANLAKRELRRYHFAFCCGWHCWLVCIPKDALHCWQDGSLVAAYPEHWSPVQKIVTCACELWFSSFSCFVCVFFFTCSKSSGVPWTVLHKCLCVCPLSFWVVCVAQNSGLPLVRSRHFRRAFSRSRPVTVVSFLWWHLGSVSICRYRHLLHCGSRRRALERRSCREQMSLWLTGFVVESYFFLLSQQPCVFVIWL